MWLYDIPRGSNIYGEIINGEAGGRIEFDHLDGMYSYCRAYSLTGEFLGVCHLAAFTPLEVCGDGYRIHKGDS